MALEMKKMSTDFSNLFTITTRFCNFNKCTVNVNY